MGERSVHSRNLITTVEDSHSESSALAEEHVAPTKGSRYYFGGFYDRAAGHGEITGSGPGFEKAMAAFEERQRQLGKVGRWIKKNEYWKKNDGTRYDVPFYINYWI